MKRGFSLLEVLLAATVIFIGIAMVMSCLSSSLTINSITEEQNIAISKMSQQAERLKTRTLTDLETEFGVGFTETSTFHVDRLTNINGTGPAVGTINAVVPNPPNDPGKLIEFIIAIDYKSEMTGADREEMILWESPNH